MRAALGVAFALLHLTLASCSSTEAPVAPRPSGQPSATASTETPTAAHREVEVFEEPSSDSWRVVMRFPTPVAGVRFERNRNRFRARSWKATADDGATAITWSDVGPAEALFANGATFQKLTLTFPTDSHHKPSDYETNVSFTEGSRLLYTGHLALRTFACPAQGSCDIETAQPSPELFARATPWRFSTSADREVLALDARAAATVEWSPGGQPQNGTYVYFGSIPALETPFGRVILDPGMPAWMDASARDFIPKALAWFAKDTSTPLSFRPLIVISFLGTSEEGRTTGGGTLPGLVQLAAGGAGFATDAPDARVGWKKFIAHELFHLWNGEMVSVVDSSKHGWLSEGSSDFFAYRALEALGEIDAAAYRKLVVRAANQCLLTLRQQALIGARRGGTPEYACGATLHAWAHGIARAKQQTIGDVLGRVYAKAKNAPDRHYDTAVVLDELRALGGADAVKPIERVLHEGVAHGADEMFAKELRRAGVEVELVRANDAVIDSPSRQTGLELAACDCDPRRTSFTTLDDGIQFHPLEECKVLSDVRVVGVEGHDVHRESGRALAALLERNPSKPIQVRLLGRPEPVPITCRADARPLPFKRLLR